MHYFIYPNSDSTLYEGGASSSINSGRDEILEIVKHMNDDGSVVNVSRVLIKFDLTSISQSIEDGLIPSSADFYLNLYDANPSELTSEDELYAYPVSQSWTEGSGKRFDNPTTTDGCSWRYRTNETTADQWVSGSNESGGTWYSGSVTNLDSVARSVEASQSFTNETEDMRMKVTNIVQHWLSGSLNNDGFMLKRSGSIGNEDTTQPEGNTTHYGNFSFFSRQTNTVFSPRLELVWDDSSFTTGSLSAFSSSELDDIVFYMKGLRPEYKENSKVRFRVAARDRYPARSFATASVASDIKYLPQTSYYSIRDAKTEDVIIPFGSGSKLSLDSTGHYFNVWLNGLQSERSYRILYKVVSGSGTLDETNEIYDNDFQFDVTR